MLFFFPGVHTWERNETFDFLFSLLLSPRKNEKDPGRGSQMTPSCKRWIKVATKKIELKGRLQHRDSIDVL